jgi:hypothetical protein
MPYNLDLEKRLDSLIDRLGIFDKRKMFGGICYLQNGNMVFGIHKQSLIIRTSPEKAAELLKREGISIFDITGRPMKGWVMISPGSLKIELQLLELLNISLDFCRTLPLK